MNAVAAEIADQASPPDRANRLAQAAVKHLLRGDSDAQPRTARTIARAQWSDSLDRPQVHAGAELFSGFLALAITVGEIRRLRPRVSRVNFTSSSITSTTRS